MSENAAHAYADGHLHNVKSGPTLICSFKSKYWHAANARPATHVLHLTRRACSVAEPYVKYTSKYTKKRLPK